MIVVCEECGKRFQVKQARFSCRGCGSVVTITDLDILSHSHHGASDAGNSPEMDFESEETALVFPSDEGGREEVRFEETLGDLSSEDPFEESASEESPLEHPPEGEPLEKPDPAESAAPPEAFGNESTVILPEGLPGKEKDVKAAEAQEDGVPGVETGAPKKGLSIRTKMILLFMLIPILGIAASGWLYIQQLQSLSELITGKSTGMVSELAERNIAEIARSVAAECSLYIASHPYFPRERFNEDPTFREMAVQPVGKTGYTALYETPGPDNVWRTWAHDNPKIIGIDMADLKKPLGKNFPGFWKVYTGASSDKESRGYYTWQDKDGEFRDKFMVCAPVNGTPYVVAATTYLYEFTEQVDKVRARAAAQTRQTRTVLLGIIAGTLLIIGLLVVSYGQKVTRRIKDLTDAAERISVGELDTEIDDTAGDEIGDLGEAISRMQDSIRLSLERLRRR